MTIIKKALLDNAKNLQATSDSPTLDAEVLLGYVLGISKEKLYGRLEQNLAADQLKKFQRLIARRQKHEPVAYITNHKEFYGLDFYVDERVLIPRPDTEVLVEEVIARYGNKNRKKIIADIGTGSGCIAVALAKNLPAAKIYAVDISKKALEVAKTNVVKHGTQKKINLLPGDLLEPLPEKVDFVIANLPYISPERFQKTEKGMPKDVRLFEPQTALLADEGGAKIYRLLLEQISQHLKAGGVIFLEIDPLVARDVTKLAQKYFPHDTPQIKKDLAGKKRVLIIETP